MFRLLQKLSGLLWASCFPLLLSAQPAAKQVVTFSPPSTVAAHRGSPVKIKFFLDIQSGYHVNSDHPKDEFLIPLRVKWNEGPLVSKRVIFPRAEQVEVGGETLDVFTGKVPIEAEFAVSPQANPGLAMLEGTLKYQACDNQSCKRPASMTLRIPVSIQ